MLRNVNKESKTHRKKLSIGKYVKWHIGKYFELSCISSFYLLRSNNLLGPRR